MNLFYDQEMNKTLEESKSILKDLLHFKETETINHKGCIMNTDSRKRPKNANQQTLFILKSLSFSAKDWTVIYLKLNV